MSDVLNFAKSILHGDNDHQDWLLNAAKKFEENLLSENKEPEWQSIESAPKDGTVIDIWTKNGRYTDCKWNPIKNCFQHWWVNDFESFEWTGLPYIATHWMPLSEPPKK